MVALATVPIGRATSVSPDPPSAVVIQQANYTGYTQPPGAWSADQLLTWHLSPDDPDPINGSYQYEVWLASPTAPTGWVGINITGVVAIPHHPGWVQWSNPFTQSGPLQPGNWNNFSFNITATNLTNNFTSIPSCTVSFDEVARLVSSRRDQCGDVVLSAPTGLYALVTQTANVSHETLVDVRWPLSADDENQTLGNLSYEVLWLNDALRATTGNFSSSGDDPRDADDGNGQRYFLYSIGGWQPDTIQLKIRAKDPLTHQWANDTCVVAVNTGVLQNDQACGTFATQLSGITGPSFPLVNVPNQAALMGLDTTVFAYFLGAVFILICAVGGFAVARALGGAVGGVLGVAGAVTLSLWPNWILIVVFMGFSAVIVTRLASSNGSGS